MDFLKRAWLSAKAKKGRTLLLCAVFSAILIFVLAGLTIRSAAFQATEEAKKSVGATVTLTANRQAMMEKMKGDTETNERPDPSAFQLTPVNLSEAQEIADLAQVKAYSFSSSSSADATDAITPVSSSSTSTETTESAAEEGGPMGGRGGFAQGQMKQSDFQVNGVLDLLTLDTFSDGTAKIVAGEAITAADVDTKQVVIEQALAEANDLAVGDTFSITDPEDEATTYELTIKGIYETADTGNSMGMQFHFLNPANTLYTSYTFANTLKGSDAKDTIDNAMYVLEDPKEMDAFVKAASALIDTDDFQLQTNDQAYQQMLQPLNNVASFAQNIVILVAVAGVIILTLIVMMTIRERRYEIGVLLSLGESRVKVILQFFSEMLVCMLVALCLAAFSGNIVGNVVGEQLLQQQTQAAAEEQPSDRQMSAGGSNRPSPSGGMGGRFGSMGASSPEAALEIDSLNITVKPIEMVYLAGFGLLIAFLSIVLASVGILRLSPKKILTT